MSESAEGSDGTSKQQSLAEGMSTIFARIERTLRINEAPEVACGCLQKKAPLRAFLLRAVTWPGTDWFFFFLILVNAAALGSQDPTQPNSTGSRSIFLLNVALNALFTVEMIAKVVAFGFYGKGSYFGDAWNWLDFAIVILGYAAFSPSFGQYTALRLLRVLRWMYKIPGIRLVLMACYNSLPGLRSVLLLNVLTMLVSVYHTFIITLFEPPTPRTAYSALTILPGLCSHCYGTLVWCYGGAVRLH